MHHQHATRTPLLRSLHEKDDHTISLLCTLRSKLSGSQQRPLPCPWSCLVQVRAAAASACPHHQVSLALVCLSTPGEKEIRRNKKNLNLMRLDIHIQLIPVRHFLEHFVCSHYLQIYLFQGKESGDSIQQVQLQKTKKDPIAKKKEWRLVCLTPVAHQLRRFGGLRRKLCSIVHPSSPLRIWQSF